jgi:hypothetical protein
MIPVALSGCRAAQLGHDQGSMRVTLLNLYQEQVLDNLVRTKLHHPIVQVDYSNMTGTVTQSVSATLNQTNTTTRNNILLSATGALLRKVSTYVSAFGSSASENAQLTMTGQPVINADQVYQAYVDAIAKDPCIIQSLDAIADDPCPSQRTARVLRDVKPHLVHTFQDATWYVPQEKAGTFFKLYLTVTVQRQTKVPITLTADTTIVGAVEFSGEWSATQPRLLVRLADKVLNDSGQMIIFNVEGVELAFRYQMDLEAQPGHPTDRVTLIYDEKNAARSRLSGSALVKAIAGKKARLKNDTFIPGFVAPAPNILEPLRSQQELLRLQQQLGR